ncbi:MAG: FadR/GntR family transcriptional regulator [Gemmobacter sp.]|jgi:GntR family transcriptional repressor for pyruvate dehydrogenase complex
MKEQNSGRKSLAEVVFDRMFKAIKSGAYAPDERLPTEHDLAAEFQVSRPIIREALKKLRDQGFIYSRQGAGSFVRQVGIRQPLGFGAVENVTGLSRCYEFRLMIEPAAAELAASRHRPDTLAAITAALDMMRDATARDRHREDADFAFHLSIARASENQYVAIAMEALESHIAVGMQFHGQSLKTTPGALERVYGEHLAIHDAIANRNGAEARRLMDRHLSHSRDRLFPAG